MTWYSLHIDIAETMVLKGFSLNVQRQKTEDPDID